MSKENEDYNYSKFYLSVYHFENISGPKVGKQAIDFSATTLDNRVVKLSDFFGKPIILETGSITCNIYVEKLTRMNTLAEEFPDYHHILLYTREAHPANHIPAHRSFQDKQRNAKLLQELEYEKRTILVDDLQGTAHRYYGALPNCVYIIDANGTVCFVDEWGSAERSRGVLTHLTANNKEPINIEKINALTKKPPLFQLLRATLRVFKRAGWGALIDFIKEIGLAILKHGTRHIPK